jgi:hypothetical protein
MNYSISIRSQDTIATEISEVGLTLGWRTSFIKFIAAAVNYNIVIWLEKN